MLDDRPLMTIDEVAEYLRLSKNTLYAMTSEKKIPHFKLGSRLVFSQSQLEQWVQQQSVAVV